MPCLGVPGEPNLVEISARLKPYGWWSKTNIRSTAATQQAAGFSDTCVQIGDGDGMLEDPEWNPTNSPQPLLNYFVECTFPSTGSQGCWQHKGVHMCVHVHGFVTAVWHGPTRWPSKATWTLCSNTCFPQLLFACPRLSRDSLFWVWLWVIVPCFQVNTLNTKICEAPLQPSKNHIFFPPLLCIAEGKKYIW